MSQQSPQKSSTSLLNTQTVPLSKPQRVDKNRELDRIARQLEGLSKSVKRLKEAT